MWLAQETQLDHDTPLAKDVLPILTTKATSYVFDKFEKEVSGEGVVRIEKTFTLFILNEDMDNIINPTTVGGEGGQIDPPWSFI